MQSYLYSGIGSLNTKGQEKLLAVLRQLSRMGANPSDLMDKIGQILVDGVHDRMERGIDPDGRPWQKSWRAGIQGNKTLIDSRRLFNAVAYQLTKGGKNVSVGIPGVIYAPLMHFGGTIRAKNSPYLKFKTPLGGWVQVKSVKVPARPILGMSVDDAQGILIEIEDYLEDAIKNA